MIRFSGSLPWAPDQPSDPPKDRRSYTTPRGITPTSVLLSEERLQTGPFPGGQFATMHGAFSDGSWHNAVLRATASTRVRATLSNIAPELWMIPFHEAQVRSVLLGDFLHWACITGPVNW
jgi:hypothetical protein